MQGSMQLKNGNYYAVIYVTKDGVKKQKWLKTNLSSTASQQEIENKLKQIIKEQGKFQNIRNSNNISFCDYYEYWLEIKKSQIELSTYENYSKYFKKIKDYFKEKEIALIDISPQDIRNFYSYLSSHNICSNTIRHYHITLNQAFSYAIKNGFLMFNPISAVEKPKPQKTRTNFYNQDDMKKLFRAVENSIIGIPVMLSAIYGLRRSEALGLKWKAIDFDNKKVYIEHKVIQVTIDHKTILYKSNQLKTSSSTRELPLLPQAEAILKNAKTKQNEQKMLLGKKYFNQYDEYVCVDDEGKLITPSRLTHTFNKILKQSKLKHIRFHDLRHSCASIMLSQNIPMKQIQEWLGHSNYATTANIYSHLDFKTKLNSANSIARVYSFVNKKYNISEQKVLNMENLTEEEILAKIKIYQRMLRCIRRKNQLN